MSVAAATPTFHRKGLIRLSWPLLCVTLVTLLATLGNTVILSQASEELNAASATANQILGFVYDVSVIFSLGALVVIAQNLGAGAGRAAQRATVVALRASGVLGLVLAVLVAGGGLIAVAAVNTPSEIVDETNTYLWIVALGMAFNAYIVAATAVLRGYGRTVAILALGIIVNVCDVALLYVFIFVLDLGIVGAALPTLIIRGLGVAILWRMIKRATGVSALTRIPKPTAGEATGPGTMARLSVPTVVENAVYNGAILFVVALINPLGTDAINARSWALTLTALVTGVILALAQGNETIVGWDVGEEAYGAASRQAARTATWTAAASAALAALLWVGAEPALSIFGADPEIVDMARPILLISIALLPLSAITAVYYGALRSAGDVIAPMIYSLIASIAVIVPLAWVLMGPGQMGLTGAFWALTAGEAVKAGALVWRWRSKAWMSIPRVVERHLPADNRDLPIQPAG